ncbi:MAG: hypothetical protein KDB27_28000 [Planctomycetales bacterium]|nr:hypothetical protein [Planctomycetales bacterium]
MRKTIKCLAFLLLTFNSAIASIVVDFETDDYGTSLVNGQQIATPGEFGNLVDVSSNVPLAIFDTDPSGPNAANAVALQTDDVLVNLGNALIFQAVYRSDTQTVAGIYDVPEDSAAGGIVHFDFKSPTRVLAIDLVDVDSQSATAILIDTEGRTRSYDVPAGFTANLRDMPNGYSTLDLTTLADQPGETGALATASEDAGFDAANATRFSVELRGSGAIDNLVFVPEPSYGIAIVGLVLTGFLRRGRAAKSMKL